MKKPSFYKFSSSADLAALISSHVTLFCKARQENFANYWEVNGLKDNFAQIVNYVQGGGLITYSDLEAQKSDNRSRLQSCQVGEKITFTQLPLDGHYPPQVKVEEALKEVWRKKSGYTWELIEVHFMYVDQKWVLEWSLENENKEKAERTKHFEELRKKEAVFRAGDDRFSKLAAIKKPVAPMDDKIKKALELLAPKGIQKPGIPRKHIFSTKVSAACKSVVTKTE